MGQKSVIVSEVSSFQRLKCMQEWYLGVLFREVSSVQECPHRERGGDISAIYICIYCTYISLTC